jgi:hypothetical protein
MMGTAYIDVHRGKAVRKTFANKALRRKMIALVEVDPADYVKNTRVAFNTRRMEHYLIEQVHDPSKPGVRVLYRYAPDNAVNLITFFE